MTLMERKWRIAQIQSSRRDAVVVYCESLITKEMEYHRLSRRVNKKGFCQESISYLQKSHENEVELMTCINETHKTFFPVFYDQLGFDNFVKLGYILHVTSA